MFSLREGIKQYGSPQGVKRDFGALALPVPGPKRMNTVPGWNWSADQPAASNAPGANALHSVNVHLIDATGYDAETLYGHPIFSVRAKEARAATAYTLDGLNEYLLNALQVSPPNAASWIQGVLKEHEVRFEGFFVSFTRDQSASNNTRTFALVIGGLHEVCVPVSQKMETNHWQQLFFVASDASATEVQAALAKRGRVVGIVPKMSGRTLCVAAEFQSQLPADDATMGAGHIAHVRARYAKPDASKVDVACAGPKSAYILGLGLHVRPSWARANLYQ